MREEIRQASVYLGRKLDLERVMFERKLKPGMLEHKPKLVMPECKGKAN